MVTRLIVKEKSEELNIPFGNLLAGVVCEEIISILAEGEYGKELYLNNAKEFSVDNYKKTNPTHIYYEFIRQLDEKMAYLYLRDINKDIITKGASEGLEIKGTVENKSIALAITVDSMYIPVKLYFEKKQENSEAGEPGFLTSTLDEEYCISYFESPKEDILVDSLFEIVTKLELINNMDCYFDVYETLSKYPINGRKVKEGLQERVKAKNLEINMNRVDIIYGYRDYSYMKKKWKVELRQKKTSQPEWQDVIECLNKFLRPIWQSMERNIVFLGDWMPQIQRYLD